MYFFRIWYLNSVALVLFPSCKYFKKLQLVQKLLSEGQSHNTIILSFFIKLKTKISHIIFIYGLFKNAVWATDYTALISRMINELERVWKETHPIPASACGGTALG